MTGESLKYIHLGIFFITFFKHATMQRGTLRWHRRGDREIGYMASTKHMRLLKWYLNIQLKDRLRESKDC